MKDARQRILNDLAVNQWQRQPLKDRPLYECPNCGKVAMQFYSHLAGNPDREDCFFCCACGSSWEM